MDVQADSFSSGRVIRKSISLAGVGKSPWSPMKMTLWRLSVMVFFRATPRVLHQRSTVRWALRPTLPGPRAPKSSKYPISGIPKILLKRAASSREKHLYRITSDVDPNKRAFGRNAIHRDFTGVSDGEECKVRVFRLHRMLFACRLTVALAELTCLFGRACVAAHLGDVAPCRNFHGCPDSAVEVDLVVFEVIASPKFVGLVASKAEGAVNRTAREGCDRTIDVNRKWRRNPGLVHLVDGFLPNGIGM